MKELLEYLKTVSPEALKTEWQTIDTTGVNSPTVKEVIDDWKQHYSSVSVSEKNAEVKISSNTQTPNYSESFFLLKLQNGNQKSCL